MTRTSSLTSPLQRPRRLLASCLLALLALLLLPAAGRAALTRVGSPLSVPATLNTSEALGYAGVNTDVPPSPEAPTGVIHTSHFGADTAIWNTAVAGGHASMPEAGQADVIRLEGCALPAAGGPSPLAQIHFQTLAPQPGGGFKVELTSQPFELPICGQDGASESTVSSYEPINLCVNRGDYVGFNDEGGFVEQYYRSGVPYQVLGDVPRSALDSFLRGGGTDDGAVFSPLETAAMEGFSASENEELMMQVELGTGPNARYVCPGGTKEAPPVLPPIDLHPQTDGINHERIVAIAIYCRLTPTCSGVATLTAGGRRVSARKVPFSVPGDTTSHVSIRLVPSIMRKIRRYDGVVTTITAVVDGQTFTQQVSVKIL